jgi:hypothetical protein
VRANPTSLGRRARATGGSTGSVSKDWSVRSPDESWATWGVCSPRVGRLLGPRANQPLAMKQDPRRRTYPHCFGIAQPSRDRVLQTCCLTEVTASPA